jgi:hypothetical protein
MTINPNESTRAGLAWWAAGTAAATALAWWLTALGV